MARMASVSSQSSRMTKQISWESVKDRGIRAFRDCIFHGREKLRGTEGGYEWEEIHKNGMLHDTTCTTCLLL